MPANENGPEPRPCDRRVKEGAIEEARGLNQHDRLLCLGTLQFMDRNGIGQVVVEHAPASDRDLAAFIPLHTNLYGIHTRMRVSYQKRITILGFSVKAEKRSWSLSRRTK
jgi:hypothetical protein